MDNLYSTSPSSDLSISSNNSSISSQSKKKQRKKNRNKQNYDQFIREERNIFEFFNSNDDEYYVEDDIYNFELVPKNKKQEEFINYLYNKELPVIFSIGPAGTGKTFISCFYAIENFINNKIDKIIITRPTVSVDEDHGFLPGSLNDKMEPWLKPIYDHFSKYVSMNYLLKLTKENKIEICPLAYMRGRTFDNCIIIADEMQNSTENQMKMILTRIGTNCKLIVNGDLEQSDNKRNGLRDFIGKYYRYEDNSKNKIKIINFDNCDIQRNPIISTILDIYES